MDQYCYYNQNMNSGNNRVYINRNFSRNMPETTTSANNNIMYFNPRFTKNSNACQVIQTVDLVKPKIHVNPNFIRPKVHSNIDNTYSSHINSNCAVNIPLASSSYANQPSNLQTTVHTGISSTYCPQINIQKQPQMAAVSMSRYCLVRKKEDVPKPPVISSVPTNINQTVKINKYKLVSLNTIKQKLVTAKVPTTPARAQTKLLQTNVVSTKHKIRLKSIPAQDTRYKYVRRNSSVLKQSPTSQGSVKRHPVTQNKSILRTSFRISKKSVVGKLKKNNIPCPLFRKYGTCLRMTLGSCDFLHDKKHVSICRKFLRGACHNENCLLSHDLTDKKMPTCYFYLQGICTKEGCPYLHVKLNEKAKICTDFLKGYCELGDKCANRHINVTKYKRSNKTNVMKTRKSNYTMTSSKSLRNVKNEIQRRPTKDDHKVKGDHSAESTETEAFTDQRYFVDVAGESNVKENEHIKPTRCKLGNLPSFIQL